MSKSSSNSYFDWELNFRKKTLKKQDKKFDSENSCSPALEKLNSLGMPESEFKKFMKEWKEKNL